MKFLIRGEKMEVTTSIKDYVIEKLSKMDKYFDEPNEIEAKVVISVKGNEQKIEITIPAKGYFLRAEVSHNDLYAATDLAIDILERQFRKFKTKLMTQQRKEELELTEEDIEDITEEIVKRKKVYLKPMDEEEAIIQMELLGHTFYVFKHVDTNNVCVIYKRNDGAYGLIETN